ncbi:MAG: zinc ribbon domain-containing protein [Clostridia bacterium]|nr:zinc ribbon domain-containing protein [Clostridia bacterium]
MQCKECKTQIPDGVKYCPDCGAMVQTDPIPQNQPIYQNSFDPTINPDAQQFPYEGQPAPKKKKKINIPGLIISVVLAVIIPVVSSYFYSNRSGSGNAPKTDYESVAVSYMENILSGTSTDDAINASAIDFVLVYDDLIDYYSKASAATPEEYLDFLSDNYMIKITNSEELLNADFSFIYDSFDEFIRDEFGSYTFSCAVADCDELTDEEIKYYYEKIDKNLNSIEKSTNDYINKSEITDAYKVKVEYVIDGSKTSDEYTNIDEFTTIIVGTEDGYKVLYDDYFIDTLLTLMTEEAE